MSIIWGPIEQNVVDLHIKIAWDWGKGGSPSFVELDLDGLLTPNGLPCRGRLVPRKRIAYNVLGAAIHFFFRFEEPCDLLFR